MSAPDALASLAGQLREEGSVVSAHVAAEGQAPAALGELVAAGPGAASDPREYALVVESVREGYLLHYGEPRVVAGADRDLALLAGDYLYALGLERLGAIGDLAAVHELSDLITLAARIHDSESDAAKARSQASALWLACCVAIAVGPSTGHEAAKSALAAGDPEAPSALFNGAREAADGSGIREELDTASDSIDFRQDLLS